MLHHYRYIGNDHAGEIRIARNRLGVAEIIEAQVEAAPGRHRYFVRACRFTVGIVDRELDMCRAIGSIEQAGGFVTGHLGVWSCAFGRNISFRDRPDLFADSHHKLMFSQMDSIIIPMQRYSFS